MVSFEFNSAVESKTVTPSDGTPVFTDGPNGEKNYARELMVLTDGVVKIKCYTGVDDTWIVTESMVPFSIPVVCSHVYSTGTSGNLLAEGSIKALK